MGSPSFYRIINTKRMFISEIQNTVWKNYNWIYLEAFRPNINELNWQIDKQMPAPIYCLNGNLVLTLHYVQPNKLRMISAFKNKHDYW